MEGHVRKYPTPVINVHIGDLNLNRGVQRGGIFVGKGSGLSTSEVDEVFDVSDGVTI